MNPLAAIEWVARLLTTVLDKVSPSPDDASKKLDNQARKDRYEAEKNWRSFAGRMRRFLANKKALILTLVAAPLLLSAASCVHPKPMSEQERENLLQRLSECERAQQETILNLMECLDRGEDLERCDGF